jgi:transcriptional regulator with XRE-family HTH domain
VVIADLTMAKARILLWALLLFQYIELTLIGCQYIEMSPRWRQELGQQIKSARKQAGLTQKDLARKAGVSPASISYYEGGQIPVDFERLIAIARVLHTAFQVRGYTLLPTSAEPTKPKSVPAQLCLDLDKDHLFDGGQLTIRPVREGGIVVKAIARGRSA